MDYKDKLKDIRTQLDGIDTQLLDLFEKRMQISDEVAEVKRQGNIALTDETREQEIVERALELVDPAYKGETIAYVRTLMALSKMRQRKQMRQQDNTERMLPQSQTPVTENANVAFQGLPGAWGEQAVLQYFGDVTHEGLNRFEDVFIAVKNKKFDYGVIPIENSQTGAIGEVYDLLRNYGCYIVGQTWVQAKQCLLGLPGTKTQEIREVFSHPEGFRQCDNYLKNMPWDLTTCRNTAVAAKMVKDKNEKRYAAIGSRRAAELNGLEVLAPDIMDDDNNKTRFIVIAAQPEYTDDSKIVSVIFRTAHRSGALCDVLFQLMSEEVNISRIESRPMSGGNYCFFTDLDGNIADEHMDAALRNAESVCGYMEVLGCYAEK